MITLDHARQERDRLMRQYRASKQAQLRELESDPVYGEKLRKFRLTLNHFGIGHAERMVEYVEGECGKWLGEASEDFKYAVLEACDNRIQRIRMNAGLAPFDDSLPGEEPTVFDLCKKAIFG